jgi:hypothetical protein
MLVPIDPTWLYQYAKGLPTGRLANFQTLLVSHVRHQAPVKLEIGRGNGHKGDICT